MIVCDNMIGMSSYLKEERQQLILEALQSAKKVTVAELAQRYGTSEVTIRRDLAELAASGKLVRAHRGALAAVQAPPEPPVVQRMSLDLAEKERIGRLAAAMVENGEAIFIGSGSTTAHVAKALLGRKSLTVVTNSVGIANELSTSNDDLTVVMTGGVLRKAELSLLGHIAELALPEVRVDKVFMGVQALDLERGWTTDHIPEVMTARRVLDMGRELIVVADHTKLGKVAAAYIAPIERIDTLVTDLSADATLLDQFRAVGINVVVA